MASIGLISCVSKKQRIASCARDLYVSPLFVKGREYIESHCDKWYILSAKHGLVSPHEIVEPYEETLKTKGREERERWASDVWDQLRHEIRPGDVIIMLAGISYRQFLVPMIQQYGCSVTIPMEGLSIGRQLQWLSLQTHKSARGNDLMRLYDSLAKLEQGLGGKRILSECSGKQCWPKRGLYLFFEPGEYRTERDEMRVVRVGTHAVSRGSTTTLWDRLHTHRGNANGLGNHRSSIFRLHVGAALSVQTPSLFVPSWGKGQSADLETRQFEQQLERAVSLHIGCMPLLWLNIPDKPGPASDRAYLERNLVGLLSSGRKPGDKPSSRWLGLFGPDNRIKASGLWNLDFADYSYSRSFLDIFDQYVSVTLGAQPLPLDSIAPRDWYWNERNRCPHNQMTLFGDDVL
jgi:hypothetical protein